MSKVCKAVLKILLLYLCLFRKNSFLLITICSYNMINQKLLIFLSNYLRPMDA